MYAIFNLRKANLKIRDFILHRIFMYGIGEEVVYPGANSLGLEGSMKNTSSSMKTNL